MTKNFKIHEYKTVQILIGVCLGRPRKVTLYCTRSQLAKEI